MEQKQGASIFHTYDEIMVYSSVGVTNLYRGNYTDVSSAHEYILPEESFIMRRNALPFIKGLPFDATMITVF